MSTTLTEAYLSLGPSFTKDQLLRKAVLERIAVAPAPGWPSNLSRFPQDKVAPIANALVGTGRGFDEAHHWLLENPGAMNSRILGQTLTSQRQASPAATAALFHLLYWHSPSEFLEELAKSDYLHKAIVDKDDTIKVEAVLVGLVQRFEWGNARSETRLTALSRGENAALLQILGVLSESVLFDLALRVPGTMYLAFLLDGCTQMIQKKVSGWQNLVSAVSSFAERLERIPPLLSKKDILKSLGKLTKVLQQLRQQKNRPRRAKSTSMTSAKKGQTKA